MVTEDLVSGEAQLDFTHPLFPRLTHLEVMPCTQEMPSGVLLSELALIPHLSHLAFDHHDHSFLAPLTLLRTCVSLRVFVELLRNNINEVQPVGHGDTKALAADPRYVVIACASYTADWQMEAHAGTDCWSRLQHSSQNEGRGKSTVGVARYCEN
jgi:hypothetical protein